MVGLLGAVFVSFSLAQTALDKGHIAVDFFLQRLPHSLQSAIGGLNSLAGTILFALAAWHAVQYAADLKTAGEVSMTLQIPTYPFVYGIALGCGMLCMVLLIEAIESFLQIRG